MRSLPPRNPWLVFAACAGCLVGGPLLGSLVAGAVAPGSETAQWLSPVALFLAFVAGMVFWFGFGVVTLVVGGLFRLLTGRVRFDKLDSSEELIPPGYRAFVPLAVTFALLAGAIAAWTSDEPSGWLVAGAHVAAGAAYGLALRALAHHGYLPFPEPE